MRFGGWRQARLAMRTHFAVQWGPADRETAGQETAGRETVGRQPALARAWEVMRFDGWRQARLAMRTGFVVQRGPADRETADRETVGRQPALARA